MPYDIERALKVLIQKELKLAVQSEMLKQQLACRYDFNIDSLYMEIDDCNLKFICSSSLKRFLVKCQIYPKDDLLIALVRRLDLDSDAKLSRSEFADGIIPIENFTKGSASQFKKSVLQKEPKPLRPATAVPRPKPTKLSNILHGVNTAQERDFFKQSNKYSYEFEHRQSGKYDIVNEDQLTADKQDFKVSKLGVGGKNSLADKEQLLEKLNRICFREIIGIQNKLEADKNALAEQSDFTVEGAFSLFSASPIQKLTPSDIEIAMQNLGLSCTTRDARLIVARYDTDSDSRIGFWEFANIFLPIDV